MFPIRDPAIYRAHPATAFLCRRTASRTGSRMRSSTTRRLHPPRRHRVGMITRLLASLACTALLAAPLHLLAAQDATGVGRIAGRVVDAAAGAGLTDVTLRVVGTNIVTTSGVNG